MEDTSVRRNEGIRRLVEKGRAAFRITENLDFYSKKDYKVAEKKFIKLCIIGQKCYRPAAKNPHITPNQMSSHEDVRDVGEYTNLGIRQ